MLHAGHCQVKGQLGSSIRRMHSEKGEEKLHLFAWVKYKQT
jgi:hypothetical protein